MCPLGKKKKGTEEIGNQKYKEYIPEPLTRANTCSYCFRACLCIGRIQTRKGRFKGASYKATQVSVLPLSVCFLNSIPSHYSCLQNLCVSTLLSLLSLSRAGTTNHTGGGCTSEAQGRCWASPKHPDQMQLSNTAKGSVSLLPAEQSGVIYKHLALKTCQVPKKPGLTQSLSHRDNFQQYGTQISTPQKCHLKLHPGKSRITGESISELLSKESPATQVETCSTHH